LEFRRTLLENTVIATEQIIELFAGTETGPSQQALLGSCPGILERETVLRIADAVPQVARQDIVRADRLASAACLLAELLDDDFCRARGARAMANVFQQSGKHAAAEEQYARALALFEQIGDEIEIGRTLATSLQPLIYLGQYPVAYAREKRAREIFTRHGERLRLARLDINLGNILHRQDRFEEALRVYRRAEQEFAVLGVVADRGLVLLNVAVCSISMHDYEGALSAYQQAREFCSENEMPLLVAQADYNIAYLYYYRGEYTRAIEQYQATAEICERAGDAYHLALCDLDRSEMYLDLRLSEESMNLAQRAESAFEDLGLNYEAAKASAFRGLAAEQQGQPLLALESFAGARERFMREQNRPWAAMLDLCSAIVLFREGRMYEALRSSRAALDFLSTASVSGKAAVANLLSALLFARLGENQKALSYCDAAPMGVEHSSPAVRVLDCYVRAEVFHAAGRSEEAYRALFSAVKLLSEIPCERRADELKIPVLKRWGAVHERLVSLAEELASSVAPSDEVFTVIEAAKSREIAELLAFRAQSLPAPAEARSSLVEQVRQLREDLNWYYRQIDVHEMRNEGDSADVVQLRARTEERERQFAGALRQWSRNDREFLSLQSGQAADLSEIREAIPQDSSFIQLFRARESFYAVVLDRTHSEFVPLSSVARIHELLHDLRQEFSKCSKDQSEAGNENRRSVTRCQNILNGLYQELVAPLREKLTGSQLIISPHDLLYSVPFHALFDGEKYLLDEFAISYALNGTLNSWTKSKTQTLNGKTLIVPSTPGHERSEPLPFSFAKDAACEQLSGADASLQTLQERGARCRHIYWETIAHLRTDNPLFSTLTLGNDRIRLLDLFQLQLPAGIVHLSGCEPGIDTSGDGSATIAMLRGLFYAGAQSTTLGLWQNSQEAKSCLAECFRKYLETGSDRPAALRAAMLKVRNQFPHPFDWAPISLWGATSPF
jgi:CHAT domain-containing protein/Tfp pilus assembly protein PilF